MFVFVVKVITLVLLLFNFLKLSVHQHCVRLTSDCSNMQLSVEFMA